MCLSKSSWGEDKCSCTAEKLALTPESVNVTFADVGCESEKAPPACGLPRRSGGNEQSMPKIEFKDKFIAFVDVLGCKALVEAAEAGDDATLNHVLGILTEYGSERHRNGFAQNGPALCPESHYFQRDLDFRVTHISDCLIVSGEVSPAGVINLVHHCWALVLNLLVVGVMARGYITRGNISHHGDQFVGSGYQKAYENEHNVAAFKRQADERGTPFVEIDRGVAEYIATDGDWCTRETFSRCVKADGRVVALFPFQRLQHSFVIGNFGAHRFDPDREKRGNQNLRESLTKMKNRVAALVDRSNPDAVSKAEHYIGALDAQLATCDRIDEILTQLGSRSSSRLL
jgi:hypothetical protein